MYKKQKTQCFATWIYDRKGKKHKLVEDHPMNIHIKIGFNQHSDFREEYLNVKVDGCKVMTISHMIL